MPKGDLMDTIKSACVMGLELIPPTLLCDSIGSIGLKAPQTVSESTTLAECVSIMQNKRVGSLLVIDRGGKLVGIFTERDCLMKIIGKVSDLSQARVIDYMTHHPISERPDVSLAFALNLMSNGGFRHVPIVDQDSMPIGIISVKDVVDHIVAKMLRAIHDAVELME
jgi:CBS domain-containing protein